ncbi:hypothetical protein ATCV1_z192R [Acanthocystis turfacea chlorella virus 1]|uniref:Uncharacterized protein z192R n=1 Tax=Chlorovirus heliozoae TaxID=322019 RepID=A7K8F2_9PHYC|nr:hypothetical protein ATCV1_z192R [Acanthocystis turfacea chlorella virus 1]ABT16326.1 hypothetical protein ATCV1_z192R [Acanthocystis turfacea chlorella virus 1]
MSRSTLTLLPSSTNLTVPLTSPGKTAIAWMGLVFISSFLSQYKKATTSTKRLNTAMCTGCMTSLLKY